MAGDHAPDDGEGHAEGSELGEMDARGRALETLLVARGRGRPVCVHPTPQRGSPHGQPITGA